MNPDDPLQALHPLREPPSVGWWPPAIGWWLLGAVLLGLLVILLTVLWRRRRRNRYRRRADDELRALLDTGLAGTTAIQQTNSVLKRAARAAYPTAPLAALGGDAWMKFLDGTLPEARRSFVSLGGDILYTPSPSPETVAAFTDAALVWVRHHRRETGDA